MLNLSTEAQSRWLSRGLVFSQTFFAKVSREGAKALSHSDAFFRAKVSREGQGIKFKIST